MKVPLDVFIQVVREFEGKATEENLYWDTNAKLDNFLDGHIDSHHCLALQRFLSAWRSTRRAIDWEAMESLWTPEMQILSGICSNKLLLYIDFEETVSLEGHDLTVGDVCKILYSRMVLIPGIGATNASKILSLSMPELFIMWDSRNIRELWKLGSTPADYLAFLKDMQKYASELVSSVQANENLTRNEAIIWLERLPLSANWNSFVSRRKPLAKLLDEFNYWLPNSNWLKTQL